MIKPLHVFWSKAALDAAGPLMASLQRTLTKECSEIGGETQDFFLHVVEHEAISAPFLCFANEHAAEWRVFVQLAQYEADRPRALPDMPATRMPYAVETEGNDAFLETSLVQ